MIGDLELPLVGWLALAGLGYWLVTMVLYVASRWVEDQRERHDFTVQCKQRQLQREAAKERQQQQAMSR